MSKKCRAIIGLSLILALTGCAEPTDLNIDETKITSDGNFLFYNSPVSAVVGDKIFFAYASKDGRVFLHSVTLEGKPLQTHLVHKFRSDRTLPRFYRSKPADDHQAPALIYDKQNKRLLIATSYHSSQMHIYQLRDNLQKVERLTSLDGNYTYPRFLQQHGVVYLLSRLISSQDNRGDLVISSSKDDFYSNKTIIRAKPNQIIYAGTPTSTPIGLAISYSVLERPGAGFTGWHIAQFDLAAGKLSATCNLSHLVNVDSVSNRPTGMSYSGGKVQVGSASFDEINQQRNINQDVNFKSNRPTNTVMIAGGDGFDCSSYKITHRALARAPYYHTDVIFDEKMNFFYFDKDKYVSSTSESDS